MNIFMNTEYGGYLFIFRKIKKMFSLHLMRDITGKGYQKIILNLYKQITQKLVNYNGPLFGLYHERLS